MVTAFSNMGATVNNLKVRPSCIINRYDFLGRINLQQP